MLEICYLVRFWHPDELYNEFTSKAANLPNECSAWGITLVHQFFYSLSSIIQGHLNEDESFQLVDPSTLQTESDQLRALLLVRTIAQSAYLKLEKQKELMVEVVGSSQSGAAVATLQKLISFVNNTANIRLICSSFNLSPQPSLLLQDTKGNPDASQNVRRIPDGHELVAHNGKQHIRNTTMGYVSKYPYGYSGCFCCGNTSTGRGCSPQESCFQSGIFQ